MFRMRMMELKNSLKFYVFLKLIEVLEIMITKITELETIKLLKYDDLFFQLKGDKPNLRSKFSNLTQGILFIKE